MFLYGELLRGAQRGVAGSSPFMSLAGDTMDTSVAFQSKTETVTVANSAHSTNELFQHETLTVSAASRFLACCGPGRVLLL